MSPLLPSLRAKDLVKTVRKCSFYFVRQKGSHQIYKHPDGRWVTIPIHPGENIGRGLLRKILNDLEINPKEFLRLLKRK
ncbi:MAG: type II toxin-antitoxin system HicA family toxin [Patescibacteria group bacterium]|jgi:predicted RNA binding protein YcfA (HicA-like mRNA interferase family)